MIIGLTGGIGSGKTTVANVFETMGCAIYNSDERAKECYFKPEIKKEIVKLLGKEAYLHDSEINKKYISLKVFNDTVLLKKLNDLIHPIVKIDFEIFAKKNASSLHIIKETALLFETDIFKLVDTTILVTAPLEIKVRRIMKRNLMTKVEIDKRMSLQLNDDRKARLAKFIINNDDSEALIPQVLSILNQL